jgi:hypothetical protein
MPVLIYVGSFHGSFVSEYFSVRDRKIQLYTVPQYGYCPRPVSRCRHTSYPRAAHGPWAPLNNSVRSHAPTDNTPDRPNHRTNVNEAQPCNNPCIIVGVQLVTNRRCAPANCLQKQGTRSLITRWRLIIATYWRTLCCHYLQQKRTSFFVRSYSLLH